MENKNLNILEKVGQTRRQISVINKKRAHLVNQVLLTKNLKINYR